MSTAPSQFSSTHGALAPVNPEQPSDHLALERREEQISAPRLYLYLNRTLDAICELDSNENLKVHNEMVRCVVYYDGRWDGHVRNGEWVDNAAVDGEIQVRDNEYKKQIDKLQMEMCRSRIEYHPEAVNKFSKEMREAAEFAERRVEVNQDRIETEPFIQAENLSLLLKTVAYRYSFFDKNADSQEKSAEMSVMKNLTQGTAVTVCRTCGKTSEQTPCPYCGDTETKEVASPDSEGMQIDQKKVSAGRVVTVRPDATMVQLDLNARDIPSSSFIRWKLVMRRCDWEAMFPNTSIPSSGESTEARHRNESQNQPSNSDWATASNSEGGGQFEKIEGELVWLDPKVYQRYKTREPEKLKSGEALPAGTKFTEQFPKGVCVARIGKTILDLYPSDKNKCWTMCVYGLREHALHGSGTVAMLGPQDTINDENAFIVAHHLYCAAGREFVRSGALEGDQLPPISKFGIINNAAPESASIVDWAYGRSQPQALSGDVYGFRESMRGSIQDHAGTSSLSMQGAADAKQLGTATGVEASRDQAVGRMIPNRKLQAFMGVEWVMQVLEMERENYTAETFLEVAGKSGEKGEVEYTERGVKAFFQSDVRNDFTAKPVEGSWMPQTPQQKRANAEGFAVAASQLKEPELISLIAPAFDQEFSVDEWGAAERAASMRLEEYARVSEVVSQGGYPPSEEMVEVVMSNTAEWARVNPEMDNHLAFRDFYEDWWMSDEARNADPLLRLVVEFVHGLHLNKGVVKQAQDQSAAQMAAQAPQMAAQEQMAQQQQQQAAEQQEQAAEQQAEGEEDAQADMINQSVGEQMMQQKDREHQAEVEVQTYEQKKAIDVQTAKQMPKSTSQSSSSRSK